MVHVVRHVRVQGRAHTHTHTHARTHSLKHTVWLFQGLLSLVKMGNYAKMTLLQQKFRLCGICHYYWVRFTDHVDSMGRIGKALINLVENRESKRPLERFRHTWTDDMKLDGSVWTELTLILITWTIWRAPTNASKWRMRFNSAFKGLNRLRMGTDSRLFWLNL